MLTAMLVEDNASFRKTIREELLLHFPALKVVEASCAEEAFKGLAACPVDLVLMDIRLQEENGLDLTRKIKSDYKDKPVVILSGFDLPEYRQAAMRYGANGFLVKGTDNVPEKILTLLSCFQGAKDAERPAPGCLALSQTA